MVGVNEKLKPYAGATSFVHNIKKPETLNRIYKRCFFCLHHHSVCVCLRLCRL